MPPKDFLKEDLSIGDTVAFLAPNYRMMVKGIVIKITPKKIIIGYYNDWNFSSRYKKTYTIEPRCVIKITKQSELLNYEEW